MPTHPDTTITVLCRCVRCRCFAPACAAQATLPVNTSSSSRSVRSLILLLGSSAFLALLSLGGCKHEPLAQPEESEPPPSGHTWTPPEDTLPPLVVCDPNTVFFQQQVLPLLVSYCATAGCHDAITHEDDVRLYDYAHIMQHVEPGDPGESEILDDGIWEDDEDDRMPPEDEPQLTAAQIALIVTWIEQGAPNNSCVPSACELTNITFSGHIAPTLNTFCTGCHGGSTPDDGIDLTTYAGVSPLVNDGRLAASIQHLSGVAAMPPVGGGLSDCRIEQVLTWIAAGAPNN